jgi:hypothetical protein
MEEEKYPNVTKLIKSSNPLMFLSGSFEYDGTMKALYNARLARDSALGLELRANGTDNADSLYLRNRKGKWCYRHLEIL